MFRFLSRTFVTRFHFHSFNSCTRSQSSPLFRLFPICSFPFYYTVSFLRGAGCCCCCCSVCWSVTPLTDFRFYCLVVSLSFFECIYRKRKRDCSRNIAISMCRNIMALKLDSDRKNICIWMCACAFHCFVNIHRELYHSFDWLPRYRANSEDTRNEGKKTRKNRPPHMCVWCIGIGYSYSSSFVCERRVCVKRLRALRTFVCMEYMCHLSVRRTFIISLVLSPILSLSSFNAKCVLCLFAWFWLR